MTAATVRVDARGVLCPVPIIRLARVAAVQPPGTVLELLTDDPAAQIDVPAWCHLRGHDLLSAEPAEVPESLPPAPPGPEPAVPNTRRGQVIRHLIRLAEAAPPTGGA